MATPRQIEIFRFPARKPYAIVYEQQMERRRAIERGEAGNALIIVEHDPVITLGRNFQASSLLHSPAFLEKAGVAVVNADRGGDATYHGPGQLVAYPILNLNEWTPSIKWYLRMLEDVIIAVLARYELRGERLEGYTGVWVGGAKVAAIGIGLHNWVTFHGIALNVDPDMAHFGMIVPCGIPDKPVTTMRALLRSPPPLDTVQDVFIEEFLRIFDCAPA